MATYQSSPGSDVDPVYDKLLRSEGVAQVIKKEQDKATQKQLKYTTASRVRALKVALQRCDQATRNLVGPLIKDDVARALIFSMYQDKNMPFEARMQTPEVVQILTEYKKKLDVEKGEREFHQLGHCRKMLEENEKSNPPEPLKLDMDQVVGALNGSLQLRQDGNKEYNAGNFERAKELHQRSLWYLTKGESIRTADQSELDKWTVIAHLNIAACNVKLERWDDVVDSCDEALLMAHPRSKERCKALYRRAKANHRKCEYDAARSDYLAALEIEPWNWEVQDALAKMESKESYKLEEEKKVAKRVMRGMTSPGVALPSQPGPYERKERKVLFEGKLSFTVEMHGFETSARLLVHDDELDRLWEACRTSLANCGVDPDGFVDQDLVDSIAASIRDQGTEVPEQRPHGYKGPDDFSDDDD